MNVQTSGGSSIPSNLGLLVENRHLRLEIGRLDIGHQTPLKTRPQTLHQSGDILRRAIARDHDLLLRIVQFVEGVEELFLRAFLRTERLDIVDQQHIRGAVARAQLRHALVLDSADHLVREALAGGVDDPHAPARHQRAPDGVHQMRLPHAHSAVNEQRIVAARRIHRHRLRRRMRKLIARADDERFKRELRIQQ